VQLVFDHQVFTSQQHGGISRYFCEVAGRLAGYDDCDVTVLAPLDDGDDVNVRLTLRGPASSVAPVETTEGNH